MKQINRSNQILGRGGSRSKASFFVPKSDWAYNERGNMLVTTPFLLLALVLISAVLYNVSVVYNQYQTAQVELERAGNVSVDWNMENNNVRDLELGIPVAATRTAMEANLINTGWEEESVGTWVRASAGRELYRVTGLTATVNTRRMDIAAVWSMRMPWLADILPPIQIPLAVKSKVLYIEP